MSDDEFWQGRLREARLLLQSVGRAQFEKLALEINPCEGKHHRCRKCLRCACLHVLIDDNEVLAGGPSW
jgi:hypothetical protein